MSIKSKLANIKQTKLMLASVLLALALALLYTWTVIGPIKTRTRTVTGLGLFPNDYYKHKPHKVLNVNRNEAKLKQCLKKFESYPDNPDGRWARSIEESLCKGRWGKWRYEHDPERIVIPITEALSNHLNVILSLFFLVSITIYIITSTLVLYAGCNNLGWKRLALVISVIPALITSYYHFLEYEDYFSAILITIPVYIVGLFVMFAGKRLFHWVKEGFSSSSAK